jgi:hypothetical protein
MFAGDSGLGRLQKPKKVLTDGQKVAAILQPSLLKSTTTSSVLSPLSPFRTVAEAYRVVDITGCEDPASLLPILPP